MSALGHHTLLMLFTKPSKSMCVYERDAKVLLKVIDGNRELNLRKFSSFERSK